MVRNLVSGTAALALGAAHVTGAAAQDYRFAGFDAPRGATATVGLRVPIGSGAERSRPDLRLTLTYGRPVGDADTLGARPVHRLELADLGLDRSGSARWRVAGLDGQIPEDPAEKQRREDHESKKNFWPGVVALILMGFIGYIAIDGSGNSSTSSPPTPGPRPG